MAIDYKDEIIPVAKISLDLDNPRFGHLELEGISTTSDEIMQNEIEKDPDTIKLIKDIMREGVVEPISVSEREDGTYMVFEGNRRTTCLRKLIRENAEPPAGVSYAEVKAHVYPKSFSKQKIEILKGRLQTGKKSWKTSDVAKYIWGLRFNYLMEVDDIAVAMQLSNKKVKEHIENWILYKDYSNTKNDTTSGQFSYFQEAPKKVRDYFTANDKNKNEYFNLISPTEGKQKIRGAAFGLRTFSKVLDDEEALDALVNNPKVSMEDAEEIMKENDALKAMPFLNRFAPLASNILNLTEEQIEQIKSDREIKVNIKKLMRACEQLVDKLNE